MYSAWYAELASPTGVAWERRSYEETRALANNAVPRVTSFYACFSHPRPVIARLQEFPRSPPAHPTSQPQPQPPSYQAQLSTTGKCERMSMRYMHVCIKGAWFHAWHMSKQHAKTALVSKRNGFKNACVHAGA